MVMWMDLGFTGFKKDYPDTIVIMPKKKPKGKELTDDAKAWNRIVSGFRVLVEHAIGEIKRFGIVSYKFRNKYVEYSRNERYFTIKLKSKRLK